MLQSFCFDILKHEFADLSQRYVICIINLAVIRIENSGAPAPQTVSNVIEELVHFLTPSNRNFRQDFIFWTWHLESNDKYCLTLRRRCHTWFFHHYSESYVSDLRFKLAGDLVGVIGVRIVAIIRENTRSGMVKKGRNMINREAVWDAAVCDSVHLTDCLGSLTRAPRGDTNDVVTALRTSISISCRTASCCVETRCVFM